MRISHSQVYVLLGCCFIKQSIAEYLLQSFTNAVGAENFTYYKLNTLGTIRINLESIEGDADLYLSSQTLQPDYENYDLKSATCGLDSIEISEDMERPVGVGVYGYTLAEVNKYYMEVIVVSEEAKSEKKRHGSQTHSSSNQFSPKKDEEESLVSTILVGILKIILDILL